VIKYTLWAVWIVIAVGSGTTIGVACGWSLHGWIGATALGFVGFCIGGLLSSSLELSLELFAAFLSGF
jgi:hypothetical protein